MSLRLKLIHHSYNLAAHFHGNGCSHLFVVCHPTFVLLSTKYLFVLKFFQNTVLDKSIGKVVAVLNKAPRHEEISLA
jgi:hypothetical protein